jgi:hypothetical protein
MTNCCWSWMNWWPSVQKSLSEEISHEYSDCNAHL